MSSLVIYGEPQSGKTEMMICLTAKLLDNGHPVIVHLMNDSVDLLTQTLKRFTNSGLAPAAKSLPELLQSSSSHQEVVVFCKKNTHDLDKLNELLSGKDGVVVIDDEADYATPNAKINQGKRTKINELVGTLLGNNGHYIGVTATPARLDLNNTFENSTEKWVNFQPHALYTGQDAFFPLDKNVAYRLTLIDQAGNKEETRSALIRFLVTVACLNCRIGAKEENYTLLVHTSGKKQDHKIDRSIIQESTNALSDVNSAEFDSLVAQVYATAKALYPGSDSDQLTKYVVGNASRTKLEVLNSERDRLVVGDIANVPPSPFTIIIGGNIVSRGVTFNNLLAMFFTRNVRNKLQQDTYIQRARMFGARGNYLEHFELTIPTKLYADWHRCFVFHKLALKTIKNKLGSPVWIGDHRVSVAAASSISSATVALDKGEMSFDIFDYSPDLESIVAQDPRSVDTLAALSEKVGNEALPNFLVEYIKAASPQGLGSLAIHASSSIAGSSDANQEAITREKGFLGKSQLESKKFPDAIHHIKMFYNGSGKARVSYKFKGSLQFVQNLKGAT